MSERINDNVILRPISSNKSENRLRDFGYGLHYKNISSKVLRNIQYPFLTMIKDVKNVNTDDEARIELAKELFSFERGCMFIAEHIFGKPKEIIEQTNIDAKSIPIVLSDGKTYEDLKNELQPE